MKPFFSIPLYKKLVGILCGLIFIVFTFILGFHRTTQYTVLPEYDHTLKKVVVSLSVANHDLNFEDSLLASLPDYTEIIILLPENNFQEISSELESKSYFQQIRLIPFETHEVTNPVYACLNFHGKDIGRVQLYKKSILPGGTPWAQDLFKASISEDGGLKLFIPPMHKCLLKEKDNFEFDNLYINKLSSIGIKIEREPFEFAGGNILIGEIQGKKIGFAGTDILRDNDALRKILPKIIPGNQEIKDIIQNDFGLDEVIFLGDPTERQPDKIFHLDQAMLFLNDGEVGISHIVGQYPENKDDYEYVKHAEAYLYDLKKQAYNPGVSCT